jgi:hypothetical protein
MATARSPTAGVSTVRGLRPELTDRSLAAVDRYAGAFLDAVRAWDAEAGPDRVVLGNLALMHDTVAEEEGVDPGDLHLAMLLERRGPAGLSPDDHAWCSAIEAVLRNRAGVDCSLHVGNGRTAVPVLPRRRWPTEGMPG